MTRLSRDLWQRLRKAGIIDTYDKYLRNEQIKEAGPYKIMRIRGIGPRVAHNLLKNAGWDMSLDELERIYDSLGERTQYEFVKAKPRAKEEEKPKQKIAIPEAPKREEIADKKERRYISLLIKTPKSFGRLFSLVKKHNGIPFDGRVPHKILHLTASPPQDILFRDAVAKVHGIANYKLPTLFTSTNAGMFKQIPKAMFFGKINIPFKLVHDPHVTFAEFDEESKCRKFCKENKDFFDKFKNIEMQIESLAIVKKGYGVEYAIPITALQTETRRFIPDEIKTFLEFLGHKDPIKYQVFAPTKDGKKIGGSVRNTYVRIIDEFVNLAKFDNENGIVCVAISEHGKKQSEDISNITKLLALTIDTDVKKDRKVNYVSTKEDHLHAISIAFVFVKKELERMGFKVGMINDSGNGAHVYVKVGIDLPENITKETWLNSDIYRRLLAIETKLRDKLKELNDVVVNIDFITKDAVRRVKVPGTVNKKDVNQAEDRICRIIHKADDYAEETNNKAFFAIKPLTESNPFVPQQQARPIILETKAVLADDEVERILNTDAKLKALFNGNVVCHGEDKSLEFKDGKIYCKSRSEAEHSLVSGLIVNGIRNFEQIDKIMMACKIGKWQEDRSGSYKRKTFEKALSFVKTTKVPISDFERLKRSITKIKK